MKQATLPPDQFAPFEIEVDIKIPALLRTKWKFRKLFGLFTRRVPQAEKHGASMAVSLTVQWPDGKLTNHIERISGKSSAPYVRNIRLVRVDTDDHWKQLSNALEKIARAEIERQRRFGGMLFRK